VDRLKEVHVYTDGACLGNPGPGGYGVVLKYGARQKELSGGYRLTTNNRMEVLAAIVALQSLKERCRVKLHTDSRYLADSINHGWANRWKVKNWAKGTRQRNNVDLWQQMLELCSRHEVSFVWIRGHKGDPLNERCDTLSVKAAQAKDLPADTMYEELSQNAPERRRVTSANISEQTVRHLDGSGN
jgi:ribonuclease HI